MICNNNYLADILRVCEIKDLFWVMRFQSPLVYFVFSDFLAIYIKSLAQENGRQFKQSSPVSTQSTTLSNASNVYEIS